MTPVPAEEEDGSIFSRKKINGFTILSDMKRDNRDIEIQDSGILGDSIFCGRKEITEE